MKKALAVLSTLIAITVVGCGGGVSQDSNSEQAGNTLSPDGWSEIRMDTDLRGYVSKTTLDSFGSFYTSWNPCHSAQQGALKDLKAWDKIVRAMNAAIKMTPTAEPTCFPLVDTDRPLDHLVAITYPGKQQIEMFVDGGYHETCTKLPDVNVAKQLVEGLHQVQVEAEQEGCWHDANH